MKLNDKKLQLFTIGHSNRTFEEFLSLLREFRITVVADIRRYPSSRKFPHFNGQGLQKLLAGQNIEYLWFEALGGYRFAAGNSRSRNTGLKSLALRNYADHMATDGFRAAVQQLVSICSKSRTAVMCAEKFYWRCHRRLLCDYLVAQGITVLHVTGPGKVSDHRLTPSALITADGELFYPSPQPGRTPVQRSLEF